MILLKDMIDVRKLLKKYHSFIYTGNRRVDLDLMAQEIKALHDNHLISTADYQQAILILRKELRNL